MTAPPLVLCRECGRDPVAARGRCFTCISLADDQDRMHDQARAFYNDNPHLLADDHDPEDDDQGAEQ